MARRSKKDSPQKAALRELMSSYMKENDVKIKDGTDVNSIMRDMRFLDHQILLNPIFLDFLGILLFCIDTRYRKTN